MAASITDKITDIRNAARPNSARVSSGRSAGGATLACDNLSGWPTASKVHFVTYTIDSNSNPVAGTQLDCSGIVSGNNIGSFTVIDGTDTGNSVNDVVEMLPTAAWGQDLADALTSQHSRTGAHKSVVNTGGLTTDTLTVSGASTLATASTSGAATLTSVVTNTIGANGANHLALSAGSNKLVKTTVLRQDNTSNTYQVGNTVILTGYGLMVPNAVTNISEAVTFGVTFANIPIVVIGNAGAATAGGTTVGATDTFNAKVHAQISAPTTSGFTAVLSTGDGTNFGNNTISFHYHWTAIGEI